jgi:hypothetical protein
MSKKTNNYVGAINSSGLSIYDPVDIGDPLYWIPSKELEDLLSDQLEGLVLAGLPLRTRSKVVKTKVCEALGYPVPKSFKKTQPRFPGQNFDTYTQKSNNLQVWNEELSPVRRYVIIKIDDTDKIVKVKVVNGDQLAILDTTGTLTQKYQARLSGLTGVPELISKSDTDEVLSIFSSKKSKFDLADPAEYPSNESLLSIEMIFNKLKNLIGKSFTDLGSVQERNRGGYLHKMVCESLGYKIYRDNGQFPDVLNQLLEVKLQTSPTIDLGLVTPDSQELLDLPMVSSIQMRHCDVRYAIFGADLVDGKITITDFILTTGKDFFKRFPRFEGKVINKKLQIPLPKNFFN